MFKFGVIAIIGKPNAGKSSIVNRLVGEKVSIVSFRPQTTRNIIKGIITTDQYQIVLVDTPGIHNGKSQLSRFMINSISTASETVDMIVYVVNGSKVIPYEEIESIKKLTNEHKLIIAINKTDIADKNLLAENLIKLNEINDVVEFIPVSATKGTNLNVLLDKLVDNLKQGDMCYDEELYTDNTLRFIASEIIREKALKNLDEEIPHGIGINIIKFSEREDGLIEINADIFCEKSSHKGIIIGKNGEMLKKISREARLDMEKQFNAKVYLATWVKVKEDWRDREMLLNELGYNKKALKKDK